jgi:hypothetical protein
MSPRLLRSSKAQQVAVGSTIAARASHSESGSGRMNATGPPSARRPRNGFRGWRRALSSLPEPRRPGSGTSRAACLPRLRSRRRLLLRPPTAWPRYMLEGSKQVPFCGSCHVMMPILKSVQATTARSPRPTTRAVWSRTTMRFTCHSGYGIWGGFDAKMHGVMHMVRRHRQVLAAADAQRSSDIDSCPGAMQRRRPPRRRSPSGSDLQKALPRMS